MFTFKLVELTSKVQEQLVFQKNQAACDKSSEQGLSVYFKKIRVLSYWHDSSNKSMPVKSARVAVLIHSILVREEKEVRWVRVRPKNSSGSSTTLPDKNCETVGEEKSSSKQNARLACTLKLPFRGKSGRPLNMLGL